MKRILVLCVVAVVSASPPLLAQILVQHSLSSGFVSSGAGSTTLSASVGQPFVGCVEAGTICIMGGFLTVNPQFVTSVASDLPEIPATFGLFQNYPNPFNSSTAIHFDLPRDSHVSLTVYDVLGKRVLTLLDEQRPAGSHRFVAELTNIPSGAYFYRIHAGGNVDVKRMILLR